jgi:hypothetical protein
VIKTKAVAVILCLVLVPIGGFTGGPAFAEGPDETSLSESIFPQTLAGLPLEFILEADKETAFGFNVPIKEGYKAYYTYGGTLIWANVLLGQSEAAVLERVDEIIPESQSGMRHEYGDIEFTPIDRIYVKEYSCPSTTYRVYAQRAWINGGMMVLGAGPYMIIVHMMSSADELELSQIKNIVQTLLERLPQISPTPTPTATLTPTPTPGKDPVREALLNKIDEAEVETLAGVLWDFDSFHRTATNSRIGFGFAVGQLLEKYSVDVGHLHELLGPEFCEKLDYAYDLNRIDSLRGYCKGNDFDGFSQAYKEYAAGKVREEFFFDEAQERITRGFEQLRISVEKGEMDSRLSMLGGILDTYSRAMSSERQNHAVSMSKSQEAAITITECIEIIDTLTGFANKLFGSTLDKAQIASALSLIWAQNQVRYWTTFAYVWGGTERLKDNPLERLREQYNLFEREEFHHGPVFAVEDGIEEVVKEWQ